MWSNFLLGLLAAGAVGFLFYFRFQRELTRTLRREREEIQTEEHRVFDFLHGLGAAFSDNIRQIDLHRLIVEGACQILDAQGGALFLSGKNQTGLIPAFNTKGCPPVMEIPPHIREQAEENPIALDSFLRLHSIPPGEGLIGKVFEENEGILLTDASKEPIFEGLIGSPFMTKSAMICPLSYANQRLGVIAIANGPTGAPFAASDFVVFKSIAEQSAFALYNAVVYSEADEKRRMDHDLQIARDIQRILLPSGSPQIESFEISGINIPAKHVSGDYFDYIRIDEDRFGVVIADVSGKGVPASLIMAMCRSVLRSQASDTPSPATVLRKVNRQLFPDIREDMFISMAYLILNQRTHEVTLARAGHDAPLLYSAATRMVKKVNPPGMALGIDSGSVFDRVTNDFSITMEKHDCLVLYTDGVTEALDLDGMEFGMEKVIQGISASAEAGAPAVIKTLTDDMTSFVGQHPQNDDITLIAIRRI